MAFSPPALLVPAAAVALTTFVLTIMIFADRMALALVVLVVPTLVVEFQTGFRNAYAPVRLDMFAPVGLALFFRMATTVVVFAVHALRVFAQPTFALIIFATPACPAVCKTRLRDANSITVSNVVALARSALRMLVRPAPVLVVEPFLRNTDRVSCLDVLATARLALGSVATRRSVRKFVAALMVLAEV